MNYSARYFISTFSFTLILLFGLSGSFAQNQPEKVVIAYFMGNGKQAEEYQVEKLTHIIYSFLHLEGNKIIANQHDSASIRHLVTLKKRNPGLKVILSLGGWGGCPTCPVVFSTDNGRKEFALSVKQALETFQADGLDLDWEYPAIESIPGYSYSEADRPNFTALIITLRNTLGPDYELSFAAGGFKDFLERSVEWDKIMPQLDYVNLMTYDIVNGYSKVTGHHTPLYSNTLQHTSTEYSIHYLDSIGVPRAKMVIGAAFYARVFKDVPDINHGLYQPGTFSAYVNFRDFETYFSQSSGYVHYWDSTALAPYSYEPDKKLFATYDNERSVELKTRYVIENDLGGIMFWSLNGDKHSGGLLDAIYRVKSESENQHH